MRIVSDITFGQRNNQNIVAPCRVSNFFKNLHQKHYLEYEIFSILKFPCRLFHAYYDSLVKSLGALYTPKLHFSNLTHNCVLYLAKYDKEKNKKLHHNLCCSKKPTIRRGSKFDLHSKKY